MSTTSFHIAVPKDFVLHRDACSYGYFLLAPNAWDPQTQTLWRVLTLESTIVRSKARAVLVGVSQFLARRPNARRGRTCRGVPLKVVCRPRISRAQRHVVLAQLTRMLRLDESAMTIAAFHSRDTRFRKGGQGRLIRSPTLFEDVVKTITSCNVQWPGTIAMNRQLCDCVGPRVSKAVRVPGLSVVAGFPTARQLANARPAMLRSRCRVGYRDERIVAVAKLFCTPPSKGGIDQSVLQSNTTPDDVLLATLLTLPGIGPYAAANIMQLLGRYHNVPLDSESLKHGREVLGFRGSKSSVLRQVKEHFAPFKEHAFRSYWFELREQYEAKHGPAHTWNGSNVGRVLSAAFKSERATARPRSKAVRAAPRSVKRASRSSARASRP